MSLEGPGAFTAELAAVLPGFSELVDSGPTRRARQGRRPFARLPRRRTPPDQQESALADLGGRAALRTRTARATLRNSRPGPLSAFGLHRPRGNKVAGDRVGTK